MTQPKKKVTPSEVKTEEEEKVIKPKPAKIAASDQTGEL